MRNVLTIIIAAGALSGCDANVSFPNIKKGAWEITSTFETSLPEAPANVQEEFNSGHRNLLKPRVSRFCFTGDEREKKLLSSTETLPWCKVEVVKQNSTERILKIKCERNGLTQSSTNRFIFSDENNYTDVIEGSAERVGSDRQPAYKMHNTSTNKGRFLGDDCSAFDAKPVSEATAALLRTLGSGR